MTSWKVHAKTFCRDLRLCDDSVGGEYWGANNADAQKLISVADYFVDNQQLLDRMGQGMLIAFMCASVSNILAQRPFTKQEAEATARVLSAARSDPELASYVWYFFDDEDASDPFTYWLALTFPGWHPKHWP
jgi:hypothetical protein